MLNAQWEKMKREDQRLGQTEGNEEEEYRWEAGWLIVPYLTAVKGSCTSDSDTENNPTFIPFQVLAIKLFNSLFYLHKNQAAVSAVNCVLKL